MYTLPNKVIFLILSLLNIKNLVEMELLNKFLKTFIRLSYWNHTIRLKSDKNIKYVLKNYNFSKFVIFTLNMTNKLAKRLGRVHSLDL